ncbi:MAG: hypothetical protein Q8S73_41020 [Deltaproteobacteria bacterium]|nr:hypothetical protein [Myxococcales bacterium]MDP3220546.1 hypothetical protein [Deltaproteobacteria bacterium]
MKLTALLHALALFTGFGRVALAQDAAGPEGGGGPQAVRTVAPPLDESASYEDGYDPDAYQQFQRDLTPYGDWRNDPRHGRVWSPSPERVGAGFAPYATAGHWSLSQYGWTWVSDYPWGWAPFHYGRWVLLSRGWAWVPGTTWGPAWVSWRAGEGYAGWAPLPPAGVPLASPGDCASCWHFVLASQLGSERLAQLPTELVASIYHRTASFNPMGTMTVNERVVRYNPGPVGLAGTQPVAPLAASALPRAHIAPPVVSTMTCTAGCAYPSPGDHVTGPSTVPTPYVAPWSGPSYYRPGRPVYLRPDRPTQPGYPPPGHPPTGYGSLPSAYGPGAWGGGFVGGGGGHWGGGSGGFVGGGGGFVGGGGHWGGRGRRGR